ncbi:MAG: hypothetical protein ACAI38_15795 [Myxococcota bacterium]
MTNAAVPSPPFRRTGRLVVFSLFAVVASYILISVIASVFLALYGKPPTLDDGAFGADDRSYCVRTLVGLRDELEQEVTNVAQPPKPRIDAKARWQAWDATYHERMSTARARCSQDDGIEHAFEKLAAMYDGYASAARRIIEVRATVAPAVADVVQLLRDPAAENL